MVFKEEEGTVAGWGSKEDEIDWVDEVEEVAVLLREVEGDLIVVFGLVGDVVQEDQRERGELEATLLCWKVGDPSVGEDLRTRWSDSSWGKALGVA